MAITLVQSNALSGTIAPGNLSVVFSGAVSVGDLLVAAFCTNFSPSTTVTVTDTLGNTYAQAGGYVTQTNLRLSLWYSIATTGGSSCTPTATPSPSASGAAAAAIADYTGVLSPTAAALDGVASNHAASVAAATAGSVSVSSTGELVVAAFVQNIPGITFAATTGTAEQNIASSSGVLGLAYLDLFNQSAAVTPAGTYSSGIATWAAIGASFFPAGGGVTVVPWFASVDSADAVPRRPALLPY